MSMSTTKRELVQRIARKTGLQQNVIKRVIQGFLDEIINELARGNRLEFRGFGTFDTVRRKERLARNPRTGEQVNVPAKTVVQFKVGRLIKERMNNTGGPSS